MRSDLANTPFWRLGLAATLLSLLTACGPDETTVDTVIAEVTVESIEMSVTRPQMREIVQPIFGSGSISAVQSSDIGPQISGIVEEIFVRVGDRVEQGAPLFQIERDNFEFAVAEAQAATELAAAMTEQAQREATRATTLTTRGVTSEARREEAESQLRVERARLAAAQVALARARNNLEDTTVLAPFRGVITERYANEGVYMTPRVSNFGSSAVVQLQEIEIVVAIVQIPEVNLSRIRLGMPGRVYVDGLDQEFDSEIHILNDRIDPETRTIEVRLGILNPDYIVRPGLFARAEIFPDPRSALLLERRAIAGPTNAPYVFVLMVGAAERREVEIRDFDADYVEIINGISTYDEVLLGPNLPRLRNGVPVTVPR